MPRVHTLANACGSCPGLVFSPSWSRQRRASRSSLLYVFVQKKKKRAKRRRERGGGEGKGEHFLDDPSFRLFNSDKSPEAVIDVRSSHFAQRAGARARAISFKTCTIACASFSFSFSFRAIASLFTNILASSLLQNSNVPSKHGRNQPEEEEEEKKREKR